jgi:hypothetical protein
MKMILQNPVFLTTYVAAGIFMIIYVAVQVKNVIFRTLEFVRLQISKNRKRVLEEVIDDG